ncbi:TetR family transcriptional regulator [Oleiphilus messinensis]|uniref:TetR family transcriptional regulator n=1 Tax=Oleiphilus messinensis TaxID=141451 RepID=A0A1Y0I979_9GAMM|nr:TetR/AcrR family transcriptional regulator [Oleiphilus messinensis]ARU57021.1 TetR family transcriptional regulator [Oleiphilus messinensis]
MAQSDTVDRILDAAEVLFAERGFSETSLRMITSKAKVNLAAVNYHFGSKNALIQAVFSRFLSPFSVMFEKELNNREQNAVSPPDVEELLRIMTTTIVSLPTRNRHGLTIFMRLLGLAYTQSQGHLRRYLETEYSRVFRRFMRLIKEATPELSNIDRFWRIQFMLGSVAFTMSSSDALSDILKNEIGVETTTVDIVNRLVPFLAAGITAPAGEQHLVVNENNKAVVRSDRDSGSRPS